MNIKFIALLSFLFATRINSMSPVDQYEYMRQELQKCKNNNYWSALMCVNKQAAFNKARDRLERPFNEIIEETKESHKTLHIAYPDYSPKYGGPIDPAALDKYFEKEKDHGLNAARHYSANRVKEIIAIDQFLDSDHLFKRVLPIDQQMVKEVKALEELNYVNRTIGHRYIWRFLRPENTKKINLVAGEMRKKIDQLQTKDTI
ncbi:MAG TPA: hypothetical protein VKR58_05090 [Aquella sp.]|jgi:hypothetical protein|nr:hypothetical protein [Aquella sp.]